ncbi:hypothetical protein H8356DRAFT_1062115 [Neocallimastix lanati (nom. inval.)]|uniref:C2 domain-containing protein n=1 Tax=Neocallimastix californiae TaxID=1754190 RepID=A0A1Y2CJX3_9FUNG|nr:hypothetical protein H8356DRAFT_1062115 [Neocallimastix sp. JGI-2020a]ORY46645.1 hypothetical protein LY90DRAFT_509192 [Neocallimastix californiae]|eukprot:ORY46645.1 hypothetical protein LY90DRAFT_509192 [Neocallimastix californiae]
MSGYLKLKIVEGKSFNVTAPETKTRGILDIKKNKKDKKDKKGKKDKSKTPVTPPSEEITDIAPIVQLKFKNQSISTKPCYIKSNEVAKWDEIFEFKLQQDEYSFMILVYNGEIKEECILGESRIGVISFKDQKKLDNWFPFYMKNKKKFIFMGEIRIIGKYIEENEYNQEEDDPDFICSKPQYINEYGNNGNNHGNYLNESGFVLNNNSDDYYDTANNYNNNITVNNNVMGNMKLSSSPGEMTMLNPQNMNAMRNNSINNNDNYQNNNYQNNNYQNNNYQNNNYQNNNTQGGIGNILTPSVYNTYSSQTFDNNGSLPHPIPGSPTLNSNGPMTSPPMNGMGPINSPPMNSMGPINSPPMNSMGPINSPPMNSMGPINSPPMNSMGPINSPPMNNMGPINSPPMNSVGPVSGTVDNYNNLPINPPVNGRVNSIHSQGSVMSNNGNRDSIYSSGSVYSIHDVPAMEKSVLPVIPDELALILSDIPSPDLTLPQNEIMEQLESRLKYKQYNQRVSLKSKQINEFNIWHERIKCDNSISHSEMKQQLLMIKEKHSNESKQLLNDHQRQLDLLHNYLETTKAAIATATAESSDTNPQTPVKTSSVSSQVSQKRNSLDKPISNNSLNRPVSNNSLSVPVNNSLNRPVKNNSLDRLDDNNLNRPINNQSLDRPVNNNLNRPINNQSLDRPVNNSHNRPVFLSLDRPINNGRNDRPNNNSHDRPAFLSLDRPSSNNNLSNIPSFLSLDRPNSNNHKRPSLSSPNGTGMNGFSSIPEMMSPSYGPIGSMNNGISSSLPNMDMNNGNPSMYDNTYNNNNDGDDFGFSLKYIKRNSNRPIPYNSKGKRQSLVVTNNDIILTGNNQNLPINQDLPTNQNLSSEGTASNFGPLIFNGRRQAKELIIRKNRYYMNHKYVKTYERSYVKFKNFKTKKDYTPNPNYTQMELKKKIPEVPKKDKYTKKLSLKIEAQKSEGHEEKKQQQQQHKNENVTVDAPKVEIQFEEPLSDDEPLISIKNKLNEKNTKEQNEDNENEEDTTETETKKKDAKNNENSDSDEDSDEDEEKKGKGKEKYNFDETSFSMLGVDINVLDDDEFEKMIKEFGDIDERIQKMATVNSEELKRILTSKKMAIERKKLAEEKKEEEEEKQNEEEEEDDEDDDSKKEEKEEKEEDEDEEDDDDDLILQHEKTIKASDFNKSHSQDSSNNEDNNDKTSKLIDNINSDDENDEFKQMLNEYEGINCELQKMNTVSTNISITSSLKNFYEEIGYSPNSISPTKKEEIKKAAEEQKITEEQKVDEGKNVDEK